MNKARELLTKTLGIKLRHHNELQGTHTPLTPYYFAEDIEKIFEGALPWSPVAPINPSQEYLLIALPTLPEKKITIEILESKARELGLI